jgi:hypothetical protein
MSALSLSAHQRMSLSSACGPRAGSYWLLGHAAAYFIVASFILLRIIDSALPMGRPLDVVEGCWRSASLQAIHGRGAVHTPTAVQPSDITRTPIFVLALLSFVFAALVLGNAIADLSPRDSGAPSPRVSWILPCELLWVDTVASTPVL